MGKTVSFWKSGGPEMTFEEDERKGRPIPGWISKDSGIEETSSEVQTLTSDPVIKRTSMRYDAAKDIITNEFATGVCSVCGIPLEANLGVVQCYYGNLSCGKCRIIHNGRSICRTHVEIHLGTKEETTVLVSIGFGLKRNETKKITGLSEVSILSIIDMLTARGYIRKKSSGLFLSRAKVTESGKGVVRDLVSAYSFDQDFKDFLQRVGWGYVAG